MTFTRQQSILWSIITFGVLIVLSLGAILLVQLPGLQSIQQRLDSDRVTLELLLQQQRESSNVAGQLEALAEKQRMLEEEIWFFADEQALFTRWELFGQEQGVEVEIDSVAEVVPSNRAITRTISLTFLGSADAVIQALEDIQAITPLLAISSVRVTPDAENQVRATMEIETVWK